MIRILAERERLCGDIVELFHLSQSTVSHHLKRLRDCGLVDVEERGTASCYRLNHDRLAEFVELLAAINHTTNDKGVSDLGQRGNGQQLSKGST